MEAGSVLGLDEDQIEEAFSRVGTTAYSFLEEGEFRPFLPSAEIAQAFEENAERLGVSNPYEEAQDAIEDIYEGLTEVTLAACVCVITD